MNRSIKSLYLQAKQLYKQSNYAYIIQLAAKQDTQSILETDPDVQELLKVIFSEYVTKVGVKERVPASRIKNRVDQGEMKVNLSPVGDYALKPGISDSEAEQMFTALKTAIISALLKNTDLGEDYDEEKTTASSSGIHKHLVYAKKLTKSISSKYINEVKQTKNLLELLTMYETFVARLNPSHQKTFEQQLDKDAFLAEFKVPSESWNMFSSEQQAFLLKKYRMYKKGTEGREALKEALAKILIWSHWGAKQKNKEDLEA